MRREVGLLIGFLVVTVGSAAILWSFALPNFAPLNFPQVTGGTISIGPNNQGRTLSTPEIQTLNDWLAHHRSGWGPLGQTPPSSGDATLTLHTTKSGKPAPDMVMTLWTGISAADWNRTAFIEPDRGAVIRIHSFSDKAFDPLLRLVEPHPYPMTGFP